MNLRSISTLFVSVSILGFAGVALAKDLSKKERKALEAEWTAAYPGQVWALKDLPVKSGMTMGIPWVGPIAEVTADGVSIDATVMGSTTMGSMQTTWFGVRPYDTLELKEAIYEDGNMVLTFDGVGGSEGRDTKIEIMGALSVDQAKASMDTIISAVDPCSLYGDWSTEVRTAIAKRQLINGMNKRQAYLVVGEPTGSSVTESDGVKVETWEPRQAEGLRIGFGADIKATGYPSEIRFEDGALVGLATGGGGGVNLDD